MIVLTYYLTSLSALVFKALAPLLRLPGEPGLWAVGTIPVWLLGAFYLSHRVRRLIERGVRSKDA